MTQCRSDAGRQAFEMPPARRARLLALTALLAFAPLCAAQPVGDVNYVLGITSAQRPGEEPRFLQKGDPLHEGDVLNTGARGFAVIGLKDGSKMTLRPGTTFAIDKFSQSEKNEAALFRLLKGGLRVVTGLIAKRNPQAVRINAATATIGIRGTSFDARICGAECAQEERAARKPVAVLPQEPIVARIAVILGEVTVAGKDGQVRSASKGTPLVNGETVRTQKDAYAVVAFRDQSLVTVVADSEFRLENVSFAGTQADSGSFVASILKGGARALTGLLGRRNPNAVQLKIGTATVGIRGTGVDAQLAPDCVGGSCNEAAFVHTWEGGIVVRVGDRILVIEIGRAGVFNPARDRLELLERVPEFFLTDPAPRPDSIKVDFGNLFAESGLDGQPGGLYVVMRDGHIVLTGPEGSIDLGPGETGFLREGQKLPVRVSVTPAFLRDDPAPLPDKFDEGSIRLMDLLECDACLVR